MDGSGKATTVLLTALLAAVFGVLAWFFYFSPAFDDITLKQGEVAAQEDFNDLFQIQVSTLARDFALLPEVVDEINVVALDVPPVEDTPGFIRTINDIFDTYSLLIQTLEVSSPTPIDNSITLKDAAAVFGKGSYVEDLQFSGLIATGFRIQYVGDASAVYLLLNELQTGQHRYFLIQSFETTLLEPAEATGAMPEIGEGWLEATLTGSFFTFVQPSIDPTFKPGATGEIPVTTLDAALSGDVEEPATN